MTFPRSSLVCALSLSDWLVVISDLMTYTGFRPPQFFSKNKNSIKKNNLSLPTYPNFFVYVTRQNINSYACAVFVLVATQVSISISHILSHYPDIESEQDSNPEYFFQYKQKCLPFNCTKLLCTSV